MRKHIDYLGVTYLMHPKRGGFWREEEKKAVIHDFPSQSNGHFKHTVVHEIVGHAYWDWARKWH